MAALKLRSLFVPALLIATACVALPSYAIGDPPNSKNMAPAKGDKDRMEKERGAKEQPADDMMQGLHKRMMRLMHAREMAMKAGDKAAVERTTAIMQKLIAVIDDAAPDLMKGDDGSADPKMSGASMSDSKSAQPENDHTFTSKREKHILTVRRPDDSKPGADGKPGPDGKMPAKPNLKDKGKSKPTDTKPEDSEEGSD